jgi:hypothetical protein
MITTAFLHGEIDSAAIGGPLGCALAVIKRGADFAAIAAVRVHHPDVCVFHGRFAVGKAAACALNRRSIFHPVTIADCIRTIPWQSGDELYCRRIAK